MIQSPTQTIPTYQSANFAPVLPLRQLADGQQKVTNKVQDAFRERYQHYMGLDKRAWNEIYSAGETVALFIAGKQLIARNPFGGGAIVLRPVKQDESTKRALNLCQFYHTNVEKMWMGSSPDIEVEPGRRTDQAEMAARGGAAIVNFYENRFYNPIFEQEQCGEAASFGTYIVGYEWDQGIKGLTAIREVVENKTTQFGAGVGYCGDCGKYGGAQEFTPDQPEDSQVKIPPMCPGCGSLSVLVEPPKTKDIQTVTGSEQYNLGNLTCRNYKILGSRWDLNYRPEHSSWFIYQQYVTPGLVKSLIGQIRAPGGDGGQTETGLEIMKRIATAGQAVSGYGSSQQGSPRDRWKLEEMYLSAEDLQDINVNGEMETISGQPLQQGSLADQFPDGAVGIGLNGFNALLGLYPEIHKGKIVSGTYHKRPGSGAGRGAVDMVEVQKRINTLDSGQLMHIATTGTPGYLYRPEVIKPDEMGYLGNPMVNIPAKDLPTGMKLEDVARPMIPGTIAPAMVQYTQSWLKENMQVAAHVMNFSEGAPGVNNKTATGAQIGDTLAHSIFSPMLEVKGYTRMRGAEIIVELFRQHVPCKQYFPLAGKRNGSDGVYLSGADLDIDLVYKVVQDSWMPKSVYTKRQDFESIAQAYGGAGQYLQMKQTAPKEVAETEKLYNISSDTENFDSIMTLNRHRLQQMQQAAQQGAPSPDLLIASIQPPISPLEPLQQMKAEWYMDFLDTTDGQQAPMILRSAVEALVAIHAQNEAQKQSMIAQLAGQVQQAGQQPQQEAAAQQQMAQAQQQQQLEAQGQGQEQDPREQAEMQEQSAQADHARQMQQAQGQQRHDRTMAAAKMGHEQLKQASDHAHKERVAAMAAKKAKAVKR